MFDTMNYTSHLLSKPYCVRSIVFLATFLLIIWLMDCDPTQIHGSKHRLQLLTIKEQKYSKGMGTQTSPGKSKGLVTPNLLVKSKQQPVIPRGRLAPSKKLDMREGQNTLLKTSKNLDSLQVLGTQEALGPHEGLQTPKELNIVSKKIFTATKLPVKKPKVGEYSYINKILKDCGELCNTSREGTRGLYFDQIIAKVNCRAIFTNNFLDVGHNKTASPKVIPKELMKYYTMAGRIPIIDRYFNQQLLNKKAKPTIWSREAIEAMIALSSNDTFTHSYGIDEAKQLRECLKVTPGVKQGRVLVIGSRSPWVEASVLAAGARAVVTLEYGRIISKHAKVKTLVPLEFRRQFLNKTLGVFDAVVTFSSIEHSGLGRYGDALNPWGDILAVARAWCVTRQNGGLAIGVEYSPKNERLAFNAGRYYGKIRYPYLTTNWKQLAAGSNKQRVFVLQKMT